MICISIAQESRRLALVDMHNAAKQCDLLEIRLDRFDKAPDVSDLLAHKPKPVILSCRRPPDGGHWQGGADERLALLRQCIISKADYVEIELDVADQIRPFPPAKRVISCTNLQETPANLADIYAEACRKNPDVVKLVTLARTPEEAWPIVQILSRATVPTVVVGLGKPGVMFTVLGKKIGAPWTYAALERGMETYPGQPTVADLHQVYHYLDIGSQTRLVGVTGFGKVEYFTTALLNAAFKSLGAPARCLPLSIGDLHVFRRVMEACNLRALVVDEANRYRILDVATEQESLVEHAHAADLILHKGDKRWSAYNVMGRAALAALEASLARRTPADKPLHDRVCMVVGTNGNARVLAYAAQRRGGVPIIAARDRNAAHELAKTLSCRYVPFEALYTTSHDVLIVCSEEKVLAKGQTTPPAGIHAGYLKPSMAVLDVTSMPGKSELAQEAEARGCLVVSPREILLEQIALQAKLITGLEAPPRERLEEALSALSFDE